MKSIRIRTKQNSLPFKLRGGRRKGAGRKPKGEKAGVPHTKRKRLSPHHPVHVTQRLKKDLPSLRRGGLFKLLRQVLTAARQRSGFRLVHFSVQTNHIHLIVEADDRQSLSRGLQGLFIRVAKALNKTWKRKGSVFADRYHDHILKTPREVRNVLCYVLNNDRKHGRSRDAMLDPFSSGAWFDGWRVGVEAPMGEIPPVVPAQTWLLQKGWRREGLIDPGEVPGAGRTESR